MSYKGRWLRSPDRLTEADRLTSRFVAYTDDFQQSFRRTVRSTPVVGGSGQICIEPGKRKTIAATLWGFVPTTNDQYNPGTDMAPSDRVRVGTTVVLHGPNYPTRVQIRRSDVQLEVSVKRDATPAAKCGHAGGGGGGGDAAGGPFRGPAGGHKQN